MSVLKPPARPYVRPDEPVKTVAIRPDGSKLLGQWQYEYTPTEGWVFNTWIEESTDAGNTNNQTN